MFLIIANKLNSQLQDDLKIIMSKRNFKSKHFSYFSALNLRIYNIFILIFKFTVTIELNNNRLYLNSNYVI